MKKLILAISPLTVTASALAGVNCTRKYKGIDYWYGTVKNGQAMLTDLDNKVFITKDEWLKNCRSQPNSDSDRYYVEGELLIGIDRYAETDEEADRLTKEIKDLQRKREIAYESKHKCPDSVSMLFDIWEAKKKNGQYFFCKRVSQVCETEEKFRKCAGSFKKDWERDQFLQVHLHNMKLNADLEYERAQKRAAREAAIRKDDEEMERKAKQQAAAQKKSPKSESQTDSLMGKAHSLFNAGKEQAESLTGKAKDLFKF